MTVLNAIFRIFAVSLEVFPNADKNKQVCSRAVSRSSNDTGFLMRVVLRSASIKLNCLSSGDLLPKYSRVVNFESINAHPALLWAVSKKKMNN